MVLNATFDNISATSWRPVLLVEETRVPGENLDLQLPMQLVPIATNVVSSNPAQTRCTQYNIM
jgi:hypothetical protein